MNLMRVYLPIFLALFVEACPILGRSGYNQTPKPMQTVRIAALAATLTFQSIGQTYIGNNASGGSSTRAATLGDRADAGGTVAVGIALSEGLVLAADSRLTWMTQVSPGYKILSDASSKLFEIGNVGVAAYGEAFLQGRSVSALVSDFRTQNKLTNRFAEPSLDLDGVAKLFAAFMGDAYDKQHPAGTPQPPLGFLFAGYLTNGTGQLLWLEFPGARIPVPVYDTKTRQGMRWQGHTDVISRLVKGYDSRLSDTSSLKLLPEQTAQFLARLNGTEYFVPYDVMQLQDGIDFALALVRITVEMEKFSFGTTDNPGVIPAVGGAVDVLVVTPSGLQWIKRKSLSAN
jgi:hypothetical protein